ncbi:GAF domain-containing protein [Paenibacillus albidus]|uniref:GAF domain-containing protein n=1 Tax=Paenibacillus albidus TaxID=2041023 RepID=UPI001BEA6262|nr:GAF domain-containing protein [Paenibacillus albidus]MBT2289336.1 GAF domain-containing protein [Paenibacillus albidus]
MKNKVDYQLELDQIRNVLGYDFMALALVESAEFDYVIKWKYASGNLNDRFKRIVLRSGRGIAGLVFKTGKPLLLSSVRNQVGLNHLFKYPIIKSEELASIGAVPLWNDARVAGVLLGGFRSGLQVNEERLEALKKYAQKGIGDLNGKELLLS